MVIFSHRNRHCLRNVALILGVSLFIVYSFYTGQRHQDYIRDNTLKCFQTETDMENLLKLTYDVHNILKDLEIDHWLMYGSILGALRTKGPLPWDYDVDIGLRGEQFLKMGEERFTNEFLSKGITINKYWVAKNGLIQVCRPGWNLNVDIFTYYDYEGIMKRPGWAAWLLIVNYELHHTFPARLVKNPLPQTKFGFFNITVPHGGNEITKYLYRFDWWKEVKPIGCN